MEQFNQIVVSEAGRLKNMAYKFTRDEEDAKDLLHETIFRALTNREKFTEGTNLQAWLSVIMRNIFINDYRRKKKRNSIFCTYFHGSEDVGRMPVFSLAEGRLEGREIYAMVHALPKVSRIPFCLYFEGYHYREIAHILNVALGTVKSRIHLARKLLRQQIECGL